MLGKAITVLSLPMVRQPAESHIRSWAVMPIKVWNGDRAVAVMTWIILTLIFEIISFKCFSDLMSHLNAQDLIHCCISYTKQFLCAFSCIWDLWFHLGLVPRACEDLFTGIEKKKTKEVAYEVKYQLYFFVIVREWSCHHRLSSYTRASYFQRDKGQTFWYHEFVALNFWDENLTWYNLMW